MKLLKVPPSESSSPADRLSVTPRPYQPKKSCFPHLGKSSKARSLNHTDPEHRHRKEAAAAFPLPNIDHQAGCRLATPGFHQPSLHRLSSQTVREMEEVFAQFDANNDGKISAEELCRVFQLLGLEMTLEEAVQMVQEVDANGDGFIDLQEFMQLHKELLQADMSEDDLRATFEIFDLNKDGCITAQELHVVLTEFGDDGRTSLEECHRMIRSVDRQGAGHVDIDDFKLMMMPTP